jgi:hypothetical protein
MGRGKGYVVLTDEWLKLEVSVNSLVLVKVEDG